MREDLAEKDYADTWFANVIRDMLADVHPAYEQDLKSDIHTYIQGPQTFDFNVCKIQTVCITVSYLLFIAL